jgi:polysaccharide export outer membrane protein
MNNAGPWWGVSLLASLIAGAALAQGDAEPPTPPTPPEDQRDYQIGPGDTLNVFVWREESLSRTVPVRPDGLISTPLVEDMAAVGKTPSELARDIEEVLSEYLRSPKVTVIVERFVGTFSAQIRVLGAVERPGPIPYRERMTLLDVVLEAGGLTEFAAGNRATLTRTVDGKQEKHRVKLARLLKGDLALNLAVRPGDVIVVPTAAF